MAIKIDGQFTLRRYTETTDGRFKELAASPGYWWDTTGIDIVPEWVVDAYMAKHPGVGIFVQHIPVDKDGRPCEF